MPNAISIEYLNSIKGQPNGLATLDSSGKVPSTEIDSTDIIAIVDTQKAIPNGIASLDSNAKVPTSQLPTVVVHNVTYKGEFATVGALQTAFPTGVTADYAFITGVGFYYWNSALGTPAWVNQFITRANYLLLTTAQQLQVPYIIT